MDLPLRAVDLIERSLDALPEPVHALLGAASVLGREFTLTEVAAAAEVARDQALDAIDVAMRGGIVEPHEEGVARFRFAHALFQEALYDALPAASRARLHRRAAQRLEERHPDDVAARISELAHHHHQSIAVGDSHRAFEVALLAAVQAERLVAFEQAARHYEQALDALDHFDHVLPQTRLRILLALGGAHRLSGDRVRRVEVFSEAMQVAQGLADGRSITRAAIGLCDLTEWSAPDERARKGVEVALESLDPDDSVGRARLTTRLAFLSVRDRESVEPIAREAVRLARTLDDPEALHEALYILHYVIAGPDDLDERAQLIGELVPLVRQCTNRDIGVIALIDIACDRLTVGDAEGARQSRAQAREVAGDRPSPSNAWHLRVYDTGLALLEGRFDQAAPARPRRPADRPAPGAPLRARLLQRPDRTARPGARAARRRRRAPARRPLERPARHSALGPGGGGPGGARAGPGGASARAARCRHGEPGGRGPQAFAGTASS